MILKTKIIKNIIDLSFKSKEGHIGSSLSILDILMQIYSTFDINNDKFILSKGHASLGLYCVLDYYNLLEYNLEEFCKFNGNIGGHPSDKIKMVEASTGSLGHGLPISIGMALGKKIKNENGNIYVLIGDGEANEGTIWESALLASHHNLNNLYCILDHNHSGDRALNLDNLIDKFNSFNWETISIDGHNENQISNALKLKSNKPVFILANTIKGKGIDFMENNPEWHHKSPSEEEMIIINNLLNEKAIS